LKPTKSWVAEWCSWNDEVGLLGKNPTMPLANEEETAKDTEAMGEPKATGLKGEMEVQVGENSCDEEAPSQIEVESLPEDIEQKDQRKLEISPVSKELKLVWEVKGIAGLSCDGQEGKLKGVLGQLVANKYGEGDSSSTGFEADGNIRLKDDCIFIKHKILSWNVKGLNEGKNRLKVRRLLSNLS
jgi:hypothetical protein